MATANILQMLVSGRANLEWFDANLDFLKGKYNNKFVAILDQKVIESDDTLDSLLRKLRKQNLDTENVIIKFVSKIKSIM